MHRPRSLRLSTLLLAAAVIACGGRTRPDPAPAPADHPAAREDALVDLDFRIAENLYTESVWPVEKEMCRGEVPPHACHEVCQATADIREISSRICRDLRGHEDSPVRYRKCRDSRELSRRGGTACSFCRGKLTRRPCPDLF